MPNSDADKKKYLKHFHSTGFVVQMLEQYADKSMTRLGHGLNDCEHIHIACTYPDLSYIVANIKSHRDK